MKQRKQRTHAFITLDYEPSYSIVDLGTLGGPHSRASSINDLGQITGESETENDTGHGRPPEHAFLYSHGRMQDLGSLGGGESSGEGINDKGQIVGNSFTHDFNINDSREHAFLYSQGRMRDLNTALPENSGWILHTAVGINNRGQIIGEGKTHGQTHAFLLTPIKTAD